MPLILTGCLDLPNITDPMFTCEKCLCEDNGKCTFSYQGFSIIKVFNEVSL